jgi:ankyrin repeat protein
MARISIILLASFGLSAALYGASADTADAAQNRDREALRSLVRQHVNVNSPQPDGTTALHWAAHWNEVEAVNLLLGAGANAKAANRYGSTPLSEAVAQGSGPLIGALLKGGADPNTVTTFDGETVLMTAARAGNVDAVKILLSHGADVNARESYRGQTALMWAASERHTPVVALLLDHGADWKVQAFERDNKPLKLSAASSITPIFRGGVTALFFSAREGDIETTRALLDHGADINQTVDADGATALVVALLNKHYGFANFLLGRGANPNLADSRGVAALYAAVESRNEDYSALPERKSDEPRSISLEAIVNLLSHGADPNAKLTKNLPGKSGMDSGDVTLDAGTTPLMRAARSGDAATMGILLEKGADPKLTTTDGNTAFMLASGVGYRDKNTRGSDAEALEAVKIAFATNPDVNQINDKGETALHGAAFRGADTIVQFLVEHGARLDIRTKLGFTPLDVAMGRGSFGLPVPHDSTVALIRKLGGPEAKDVKEATERAEASRN